MATPNCSTYGQSNCSRQDGQIMGFEVGVWGCFSGSFAPYLEWFIKMVGRSLWSLWSKGCAGGQLEELSTASAPVRGTRIVHKSTGLPRGLGSRAACFCLYWIHESVGTGAAIRAAASLR